MKAIAYLRARLEERSTFMFLFASLGSAAAFPRPFNWIGFGVLVLASLVPDATS